MKEDLEESVDLILSDEKGVKEGAILEEGMTKVLGLLTWRRMGRPFSRLAGRPATMEGRRLLLVRRRPGGCTSWMRPKGWPQREMEVP